MAVPNSAVDQLTAITNEYFMKDFPDLVFNQNVLFQRLHARGTKVQSGTKIRTPVKYKFTKHGAYRSFDLGSTDAEDQISAAQFEWKQYREPIVIARDEQLKNEGPEGMFRFIKAKMELAQSAIRDDLGTDAFHWATADDPDAHGDAEKEINSLVNLIGDGTFPVSSTTAGAINKATASNAFWRGNANDESGALAEASLRELWFDCVDGSIHPDLIISHNDQLEAYQALIPERQRFVNTSVAETGFTQIAYQGQPWIADLHCNAGHLFMLRVDTLDLVSHRDENFRLEAFQKPVNQNVMIAWIYWMGNLVISDPRRNGLLYGIT